METTPVTKDFFLHIGTFKTGTTAIQTLLSTSRQRLLKEYGTLYPQTAEIAAGGHHNLVYEFTGSWKYDERRGGFNQLAAEFKKSGANRLIISAENLSSYPIGNPDIANRFAQFAADLNLRAKVVCYVRPQWEYIDSYYSQGAKSGYITQDYAGYVQLAINMPMFDYEKVLLPWESLFKVELHPYPRDRSILQDFLAAVQLPSEVASERVELRANERMGARGLEFIRRCAATLERSKSPVKRRVQVARRMREEIAKLGIPDQPFSGLTPASIRAVRQAFLDSNTRLSQRYGLDPQWFALPAEEPTINVFDLLQASESDLRLYEDILMRVWSAG